MARVTTWGTFDGESWKNNFPVRGRTNYPLLFVVGVPTTVPSTEKVTVEP